MRGFTIPSVNGRVESNIGYVKINGFYKNTASEFKETVEKLIDNGAESMIFDVRNTYSGTIEYAAQVIDVIVPAISGNIAIANDKNGEKKAVFTAENSSVTMPFVVLVNASTSGPAELFACDLSDISQAQIVGKKTAGVGTMQELFALEDGGAVLLTVALVEPKGGETSVYNGIGIEPDYDVDLNVGYGTNIALLTVSEDTQLSTAINLLSSTF
jgi:carboxyl-terminal processing protease